jgi:hypothetical protein
MVWTKMLIKTSLATTLAGGFMFFGNAPTSARMTGTAATKTSRIWNGNWIAMSNVMAQIAARQNTTGMKWKKHGIAARSASATMTATVITTTTTTGTVTGITKITATDKRWLNLPTANNP